MASYGMIFRHLSVFLLVLILAEAGCCSQAVRQKGVQSAYPYGGKEFTGLVADSYRYCSIRNPGAFYDFMDRAWRKYPAKNGESATLQGFLDAKRRAVGAIKTTTGRTDSEKSLAAFLHRFIKKSIPKFSLDRGFEFPSVVKTGERQCFLQSVLLAGMLQRAGVDAGVAMIYKNRHGEESNNGHAVTLVKLSNGRDIIVDVSEKEPFHTHEGLFVRAPGCRYANPVYYKGTEQIAAYYTASDDKDVLRAAEIGPLGVDFIRSQFWYYRGERAPGGIMAETPTTAGLQKTVRCLRRSSGLFSSNPLPVYMLGKTYLRLGNSKLAEESLTRARNLYSRLGWTPPGLSDQIAELQKQTAEPIEDD